MAKVKKMKVGAEYVETPEQREKFIQSGAVYLQEYLIGKPLPLSELRA
jgi:EAL domain-containing protein (putative c-di-GMP-specific phosphodiesterase class I)